MAMLSSRAPAKLSQGNSFATFASEADRDAGREEREWERAGAGERERMNRAGELSGGNCAEM